MASSDNVFTPEDSDEVKALQENELKDQHVIYIFSASWCGPCKVYKKMWMDEAKKNPGVMFVYVDVDDCPSAADKYGAKRLPTTVIVNKYGKEIRRFEDKMVNLLRAGLEQLKE